MHTETSDPCTLEPESSMASAWAGPAAPEPAAGAKGAVPSRWRKGRVAHQRHLPEPGRGARRRGERGHAQAPDRGRDAGFGFTHQGLKTLGHRRGYVKPAVVASRIRQSGGRFPPATG